MELAAASAVHFVNSLYLLPVDEVLFFRQIMHSFFLPGMVLLGTVKVSTYQKYNSIDVRHISRNMIATYFRIKN